MQKALIAALALVIFGSFAQADGAKAKPASAKAKVPGKVASKLPAKKGAVQGQVASAPAAKAAPSKTAARGIASVSDSNSALEVTGQSRNLSMMLTLRNRKNDINFVKPRENYSNEIQNTSY